MQADAIRARSEADGIEVASQIVNHDLGFGEGTEYFAVEQFVSKAEVETLNVSNLEEMVLQTVSGSWQSLGLPGSMQAVCTPTASI